MSWYDIYRNKNNKKNFDISLEDLTKWGNIFGDDDSKKLISNWGNKSAKDLWKDKNSGIDTIFGQFTKWVGKNKDSNAIGSPDTGNYSNSSYSTYQPNNGNRHWVFNQGSPSNPIVTEGTTAPYISSIPAPDLPTNLVESAITKGVQPVPIQNLNRRQTRDYLRQKGINPYSLSGAQRRAIRLVHNGQARDNENNIVKQLYTNKILKQGGTMYKYQDSGAAPEQDQQQQIIALVQAAAQGDEQATQTIQQIQQAAQQGNQQAAQMLQMIQEVMQQMQGQQSQMARQGAKLSYIKRLKGQCPQGTQMTYYKVGGKVCKKCMSIEEEKCGGKTKKRKMKCGGVSKTVKGIRSGMRKGEIGLEIKDKNPKRQSNIEKARAAYRKDVSRGKDEAAKDSIRVNKYNDQEIQNTDKGDYKKGIWVPNRKMYPKKQFGGLLNKYL